MQAYLSGDACKTPNTIVEYDLMLPLDSGFARKRGSGLKNRAKLRNADAASEQDPGFRTADPRITGNPPF